MTTHVLEGTWEEVAKHAKDLIGKRVSVTVFDDEPTSNRKPNKGMLEALRRVKERQKDMRETSGESSVDIIRRGRAGEMFGYEPSE